MVSGSYVTGIELPNKMLCLPEKLCFAKFHRNQLHCKKYIVIYGLDVPFQRQPLLEARFLGAI